MAETVNRSRRPSKREPTTINIQLFRRVRNAGRSRKGMNRRPLSVDLGLLEPLEASQSTYGRQAVLDRSLGCKTTMNSAATVPGKRGTSEPLRRKSPLTLGTRIAAKAPSFGLLLRNRA